MKIAERINNDLIHDFEWNRKELFSDDDLLFEVKMWILENIYLSCGLCKSKAILNECFIILPKGVFIIITFM